MFGVLSPSFSSYSFYIITENSPFINQHSSYSLYYSIATVKNGSLDQSFTIKSDTNLKVPPTFTEIHNKITDIQEHTIPWSLSVNMPNYLIYSTFTASNKTR